jgi:hypothetical protein
MEPQTIHHLIARLDSLEKKVSQQAAQQAAGAILPKPPPDLLQVKGEDLDVFTVKDDDADLLDFGLPDPDGRDMADAARLNDLANTMNLPTATPPPSGSNQV